VAAGAARSRIRLFEEAGIAVMMWHMPVMAMCATSMTTAMCTAALATATSTIPCCIVIIFIIIVDAAIAMTIAIAFAIAIAIAFAMAIAAASASLSTAMNAAAVAAVARAPISTAIAAAAAEAVVIAVAVAIPVASASASLSTAINAAAVAIAAASASLSTAISAAAIAIAAALSAAWSAALSAAALSPTTARNRLQTRRARPTVAFLSPPHHIVGGNRQSIRYSSCIPSGRCLQDDSLLSHAGLMLPELIIVNIGHLLTNNHVTFCSRPQNSNALFECICGWNLFRLFSLEAQRWQTSCTIRNPLESSVLYADGSLRLSPMRSSFSWFCNGLVWSCCT
jgi:hypothetical protein